MILDGVDMVCVNLSAAAWPWGGCCLSGPIGCRPPAHACAGADPRARAELDQRSRNLPIVAFSPGRGKRPARCRPQTKGTRQARPFRFQRYTAGWLLLYREILAGGRLAVQRDLHLVVAGGEAIRLADHEGSGLRTHRVQCLAVLVHGL